MQCPSVAEALDAARMLGRPDGESAAHANAVLQRLVASPGGWPVAASLAGCAEEHVAFVGLNCALQMVRRDPDGLRADELYDTLWARLRASRESPLVRHRCCLLLAALAADCGGEAVGELVEDALQEEPPLAVPVLTAVAEEVLGSRRAGTHSCDVTLALQDACDPVCAHLTRWGATPGVFACLQRWVSAGVTLSQCAEGPQPSLLKALLAPLTEENAAEADVCAAGEALSELLTAVDPLPGRDDAVSETAHSLAGAWVSLTAAGGVAWGAPRARALLSVAAAFVGAEAVFTLRSLASPGAPGPSAALRLLLHASASAPPHLAAVALRPAWSQLAVAWLSGHGGGLRPDVFNALMAALLSRAALALGDGGGNDEEETELMAAEAADAACASARVLGAPLAASLCAELAQAPQAPQRVHGALWAAWACASSFSCEDASLARAVLHACVHASSPRAASTAADALAALALTLAHCSDAELSCRAVQAALSLFTHAGEKAAAALEALCREAACSLAAARALAPMLSAAEAAMCSAPQGLPLAPVVSALAAVAAALPPPEALPALLSLVVPLLQRCRWRMGSSADAAALAEEIEALAAWTERAAGRVVGHQAAAAVLDELWALTQSAAASSAGSEERVNCACAAVWTQIAGASSWAATSSNQALARAAMAAEQLWCAHASPAAAECIIALVQLRSRDPSVSAALLSVLRSAPRVGALGADAAAALLELALCGWRDCPGSLGDQELWALTQAAAQCMSAREAAPAGAAARLLAALLQRTESEPREEGELRGALSQRLATACAPQIAQCAVCAAVDSAHPDALVDVAAALRAALDSLQAPGERQSVLRAALAGRPAAAAAAFQAVASRAQPLSEARFAGALTTFASVARGEAALDALEAFC